MNKYTPDRWVVLTITNKDGRSHDRVFAGWYGGYTGSDSWQLNSGITKVVDCDTYLSFQGDSGSIYKCYKHSYGMSAYMYSVLVNFQKDVMVPNSPITSIEVSTAYERKFNC